MSNCCVVCLVSVISEQFKYPDANATKETRIKKAVRDILMLMS